MKQQLLQLSGSSIVPETLAIIYMSMASKTPALAFFLTINVLFFSMASACGTCSPYPKPPAPKPVPPTPKLPMPTPSSSGNCPIDALKLGVCANVLQGLINVVIGTPPKEPCCSLISGLVDLEAAVCVCTAIKANVLGINLNVDVDLTLLLNYCGKQCPTGFQCA